MRIIAITSKQFKSRCKHIREVLQCSWRKAVIVALREFDRKDICIVRYSRDGHEYSNVRKAGK